MFEQIPANSSNNNKTRLTITVYTTDHCIFCKETIRIVKRTATRHRPLVGFLKVVEQNIERMDREKHQHINAVPTIEVGSMTFVGFPSAEDVEFLINQALLSALA